MILFKRLASVISAASLLVILAASPSPAQTVKSQTEAADPTTPDSVAASLENTAHSLEKNGGLRGSNMQWHSPANSTEYRALARYIPVLVVVVSQDESELPLKRVYVDANGTQTELEKISSIRSVDFLLLLGFEFTNVLTQPGSRIASQQRGRQRTTRGGEFLRGL